MLAIRSSLQAPTIFLERKPNELRVNNYAKLENLSLSDWTAWYDSCGKPYIKPSHELDIDNYPLEANLDDNDDDDDVERKMSIKIKEGLKA